MSVVRVTKCDACGAVTDLYANGWYEIKTTERKVHACSPSCLRMLVEPPWSQGEFMTARVIKPKMRGIRAVEVVEVCDAV